MVLAEHISKNQEDEGRVGGRRRGNEEGESNKHFVVVYCLCLGYAVGVRLVYCFHLWYTYIVVFAVSYC